MSLSGKTKLPHQPVVLATAGSPRSAWLLFALLRWARYAEVERDGWVWVVRSHEDWMEDTGLGYGQVKRAFVELRERGVVVTTKGLFGMRCMNFVRLTAEGSKQLGFPEMRP